MRKSKIYLLSKDDLAKIVAETKSISDILKSLGLNPSSGNYKTLKKRLLEESIDSSHIKGSGHNLGGSRPTISLDEILIEQSTYTNNNFLKSRLLREKLLEEKCSKCSITNEWNGEFLSLQLDHINGNSRDNRLSNLRILCPNCHSQTETYAGKSVTKNLSKQCILCGIKISTIKSRCRKCFSSSRLNQKTKIVWPNIELLCKMVNQNGYMSVSKQLGVSDNAVRKRIRKFAGAEGIEPS